MTQLLEKAWHIRVKDLSEPWNYEDIYVTAENRGQARSKGLSEMLQQGAEKLKTYKYEDNEIKYTDIIAHRSKDYDTILFEDKKMSHRDVQQYLWCKERDDKALKFTETNPDDLFVVWNGSYGSYWGANHSGYSSSIVFAGKYTAKEAYNIVRGSSYGRKEEVRLLDKKQFNKDLDAQIEAKQKEIDRLNNYRL